MDPKRSRHDCCKKAEQTWANRCIRAAAVHAGRTLHVRAAHARIAVAVAVLAPPYAAMLVLDGCGRREQPTRAYSRCSKQQSLDCTTSERRPRSQVRFRRKAIKPLSSSSAMGHWRAVHCGLVLNGWGRFV